MRLSALLGAPVLAVLLLAGCATGSAAPTTSPAPPVVTDTGTPASPTPPSSPSPTTDPVEAEILRVYAEFMDARNSTLSRPMLAPSENLEIYSINPAKNGVLSLAVYYRSKGLRIRGAPISQVESVRVLPTTDTAEIKDCVDSTESYPVDAKTGKSARAPGDPQEVLVTSTVVRQGQRWLVATWSPDRETPCTA